MKMSADTAEKNLTSSQKRAIEATDKWIAVVASAGSGKTTVLIDRCLSVLEGDPGNLDRLLAITFTDKAAAEILSRLRRSLPPKSHHLLATAWIGTFHAFCARVLRANAPLVDLDPSFEILDENAFRLTTQDAVKNGLVRLIDERDPHVLLLVEELEFRNTLPLLEELLSFRWHSRTSLAGTPAGGQGEQDVHRALAHCYRIIEKELLGEMKLRDAIDFQELEIKTLELLSSRPSVRAAYQRKFRHILVDEYQDTSDVQSELVFLLANPKVNRLAIVGDPRQSIYRFRGANVHCFETALKKIEAAGGEVVTLQENFRSEPAIISVVNRTFGGLWDGLGQKIPPMKSARADVKNVPAVAVLHFETGEDESSLSLRQVEADGIAERIKEMVRSGKFKYSQIACLFQAMTNVSEYEAAFKRAGVPYRIFGGRGLLERQEVNDLMHALAYAHDPDNDVALVGLLRSPLVGLSDNELTLMAGSDGRRLRDSLGKAKDTSLLEFLEGAPRHMRPSEILKRTIAMTGYEFVCNSLDPSGGMQANLERLIALAQSLEHEGPTQLGSFIWFVTELRQRSARLGDPPALGFGGDAVLCMTVHTSKGLEFPAVIIPDLIRKQRNQTGPWRFSRQEGVGFKLKDPSRPFGERIDTERFKHLTAVDGAEEAEESKRLLYVAMTRARDLLVLPLHELEKTQGRWHEWLEPMLKGPTRDIETSRIAKQGSRGGFGSRGITPMDAPAPETLPPLPAAAFGIRERRLAAPKIFSVSELETYEHCPSEYFLKYVMDLPANDILKNEGEKIAANVRGSIVHAVLQRYDPSKEQDIEALIVSECFATSVIADRRTLKEIERPLAAFAANPVSREISKGSRELRFDLNLDGKIVTGSIDWLRPVKDGYAVVDFKTDMIGKNDVDARAAEYELQLTTYAIAAETATGRPVKETSLYFLEPDIIHTRPMTSERATNVRKRITDIIGSIESGKFGLGSGTPPCYKCYYRQNGMCSLGLS